MLLTKTAAQLLPVALVLALGALGCGASAPSHQLIAARSIVQDAARGRANTLAAGEVLSARKMLRKAEAERTGSAEEAHYAYLADRIARRAIASANATIHEYRTRAAQEEYERRIEELHRQAIQGLQAVRNELTDVRTTLAGIEQRLDAGEGDPDELRRQRAGLMTRERELLDELWARETSLLGEDEARRGAQQRLRTALARLAEPRGAFRDDGEGTVLTLPLTALFGKGEVELLPSAKQGLDRVANVLRDVDDDRVIVVMGHTDSRGARENNRKLSLERAAAVRQYLVEHGVRPHTIRAIGRGEMNPIADNHTPEGRANNRRVEIAIRDKKATTKSEDLAVR